MILREKMIERLHKLFALSRSANEHEAELAMERASRLMTEHQIAMTDLEVTEEGLIGSEDVELSSGRRSIWLCILADGCAALYDAKAIRKSDNVGPGLGLRFIGTKSDIAAARLTFDHLHRSWTSIVRLKTEGMAPADVRAFRRAHGAGFASAIRGRAKALAAQRNGVVEKTTGRDLVLTKEAQVSAYLATLNLKKQRFGRFNKSGYESGYEQGRVIPLAGAIDNPLVLAIPDDREPF